MHSLDATDRLGSGLGIDFSDIVPGRTTEKGKINGSFLPPSSPEPCISPRRLHSASTHTHSLALDPDDSFGFLAAERRLKSIRSRNNAFKAIGLHSRHGQASSILHVGRHRSSSRGPNRNRASLSISLSPWDSMLALSSPSFAGSVRSDASHRVHQIPTPKKDPVITDATQGVLETPIPRAFLPVETNTPLSSVKPRYHLVKLKSLPTFRALSPLTPTPLRPKPSPLHPLTSPATSDVNEALEVPDTNKSSSPRPPQLKSIHSTKSRKGTKKAPSVDNKPLAKRKVRGPRNAPSRRKKKHDIEREEIPLEEEDISDVRAFLYISLSHLTDTLRL